MRVEGTAQSSKKAEKGLWYIQRPTHKAPFPYIIMKLQDMNKKKKNKKLRRLCDSGAMSKLLEKPGICLHIFGIGNRVENNWRTA